MEDNIMPAGAHDARDHAAQLSLTWGYHLEFWIAASLVPGAIVAAVTVLRPERQVGAGKEQEMAGADRAFCEVS